MLTEFLHSWAMFQDSYLAALLSGALLSILGVLVVGRNEVFLAAAVAQASVLGVALALTFAWSQPTALAIAFSILAALLAGRRERRGGTRREEVTAWFFLLASSLAVLALSRSPVGMKNVQSVLASTVLGATRTDVYLFAGLSLAVFAAIAASRQQLTLLILDPVMAAAVGLNLTTWSLVLSGAIGLATGLAIQSTGFLFTFGCLVLPALIAKNLCRRVQPMFLVAPSLALFAIFLGLVVAHYFDFPPGQVVVALLCLLLAITW